MAFRFLRQMQPSGSAGSDVRDGAAIVVTAAAAALALGYMLSYQGAKWAVLALGAIAGGVWICQRRGNGLLVAVVALLVVPYWYPRVWLIAPLAIAAGMVAGMARTRLHVIDTIIGLLVLTFLASWAFHPELQISLREALQGVVPFGFYFGARLTTDRQSVSRLQWVALAAATVGACTVLYEATRGVTVFADPLIYQWSASHSQLFRPGGIFGGSPAAAIVLAMVLLSSVSLYRARPGLFRVLALVIVAAILITLDRAGFLALVIGSILYAAIAPYRQWGRMVLGAFAVGIAVFAVTTSSSAVSKLSSTDLIAKGVIRSETIEQRASLFDDSIPLLADTPEHLWFGRGFDSMGALGARRDTQLAETPNLWVVHNGPNNDYLRAILEQGLLGFAGLLLWLLASVWFGIRGCLREAPGSRERRLMSGLTAATLGFALTGLSHDNSHNFVVLSAGCLVTGVLVSVYLDRSRPRSEAVTGRPA